MLERDLAISECIETDLVDHHPNYCSVDPATCRDLGMRGNAALIRLLSWLIGSSIDPAELKLTSVTLQRGWNELLYRLHQLDAPYSGEITYRHAASVPLARAMLSSFALGRDQDVLGMSRAFRSWDDVMRSCAKAMTEISAISRWQDLVEFEHWDRAFAEATGER